MVAGDEVALDGRTVLLKTPRAAEEIRTRAHGLPALSRRLLIVADGQRPVAELAAQLDRQPEDPEVRAALNALIDAQFLQVRDDLPVEPAGGGSGLRSLGMRFRGFRS
jgi:hypothetical protein